MEIDHVEKNKNIMFSLHLAGLWPWGTLVAARPAGLRDALVVERVADLVDCWQFGLSHLSLGLNL